MFQVPLVNMRLKITPTPSNTPTNTPTLTPTSTICPTPSVTQTTTPSSTPPSPEFLLQEDGSLILQEDNGQIVI